ncbi:imidazole glycerol phosphate synthase subunit HisH [Anaeromyxobacter sp. Fw109-5]|uniref:imidazole glycerol phosphate synthase subunit HisH n=1 Tax=Anaeromyxobacter sp. (strain Fw109-5) TaxID=404589 RepID=UPI0000ED7715|nr:imidazole glycerol phosphate synthase subunit HisH [Anaeromyxobacter sp. Fw109-5]ABS24968.1 imidazole glycerol phosphate synthase, glutamine amidotransferase subunit [Anaeromyxobacter sp. Fw109-5]
MTRPPGTIALVDYGAGNLRSVENALREVGAQVVVTRDPEAVRRADRVVVPGQGSMPECAEAMRRSGVAEALRDAIARGAPVLGICVGLQILFEEGEEAGGAKGLGIVQGRIRRLPAGVKLPHIGWSPVRLVGSRPPLFAPMDGAYVYFAHSYAAPADAPGVALVTTHGETYCAALARENLFAVQFHPEKSQQVGLALLSRFVAI